jgi:hypothetical protein
VLGLPGQQGSAVRRRLDCCWTLQLALEALQLLDWGPERAAFLLEQGWAAGEGAGGGGCAAAQQDSDDEQLQQQRWEEHLCGTVYRRLRDRYGQARPAAGPGVGDFDACMASLMRQLVVAAKERGQAALQEQPGPRRLVLLLSNHSAGLLLLTLLTVDQGEAKKEGGLQQAGRRGRRALATGRSPAVIHAYMHASLRWCTANRQPELAAEWPLRPARPAARCRRQAAAAHRLLGAPPPDQGAAGRAGAAAGPGEQLQQRQQASDSWRASSPWPPARLQLARVGSAMGRSSHSPPPHPPNQVRVAAGHGGRGGQLPGRLAARDWRGREGQAARGALVGCAGRVPWLEVGSGSSVAAPLLAHAACCWPSRVLALLAASSACLGARLPGTMHGWTMPGNIQLHPGLPVIKAPGPACLLP